MERSTKLKEHGKISVYDRGYGWLPKLLRSELDAKESSDIPFFVDADTALLIRNGACRTEVLTGLGALIRHLMAKWKISEEEVLKRLGF